MKVVLCTNRRLLSEVVESFLKKADTAFCKAKQSGKNRVIFESFIVE